MPTVEMTVNGKRASAQVEGRTLLVQFLREKLGLTGTHIGCDTSQCGACVVHVDGRAVKSCTMLAVQAAGATSRGWPGASTVPEAGASFRKKNCTVDSTMSAIRTNCPR